jgi:hypothetical protein
MTLPSNVAARFAFQISSIHFPSLDRVDHMNGKYGIAVPVGDIPAGLAAMIPEAMRSANASKWKLVNLGGPMKPLVFDTEPGPARLLELRRELQARGESLDTCLRERPAEVIVDLAEKKDGASGGYDAYWINLIALRIDVQAVLYGLTTFDALAADATRGT